MKGRGPRVHAYIVGRWGGGRDFAGDPARRCFPCFPKQTLFPCGVHGLHGVLPSRSASMVCMVCFGSRAARCVPLHIISFRPAVKNNPCVFLPRKKKQKAAEKKPRIAPVARAVGFCPPAACLVLSVRFCPAAKNNPCIFLPRKKKQKAAEKKTPHSAGLLRFT